MQSFLLALQFLTRLPVPAARDFGPQLVGRSLLFHPLVGTLIGGLLMGLAVLLAPAPAPLAAALVLAAWVLITGALHLDGLADSVDAWVVGHGDRERTLAIMKDPASGPMGVTALVLTLLLKFVALQTLVASQPVALLLAPLLGRTALPLLFLTTPYVRPGGLGEAMATHLPRAGAVPVIALGAVVAVAVGGILPVLAALAAFALLRRLMVQRIAGTTGDTAGALVELVEIAVLLTLALNGVTGAR
ncbi:MAG: adenosylcobinamide-GDP ribazoletransferase [Thiohalomonadaceae bacterium]